MNNGYHIDLPIVVPKIREEMEYEKIYSKKEFYEEFLGLPSIDRQKMEECLLSVFNKLDTKTKNYLLRIAQIERDFEFLSFCLARDYSCGDRDRMYKSIEVINQYCRKKGEGFWLDGKVSGKVMKRYFPSSVIRGIEDVGSLTRTKKKRVEEALKGGNLTEEEKKVGEMVNDGLDKISSDTAFTIRMVQKVIEGEVPKQIVNKKNRVSRIGRGIK